MQTSGGGAPRISDAHKPHARRTTVAGQPEGLLFRLDGGGQAAPAVNRPPAAGAGPVGLKAPSCAVLGSTGRARFARPACTAGRPSLAPRGACPHALASAPASGLGGCLRAFGARPPPFVGEDRLQGGRLCRPPFADPSFAPFATLSGLRSGIGRPDGLPRLHPSLSRRSLCSRRHRYGVRAVRIDRCALAAHDALPARKGVAERRPFGPSLRHPGLRPPLDTGRWGALTVTTDAARPVPVCRRLPPPSGGRPGGRRTLRGGVATVASVFRLRCARRQPVRTLLLAPRSPLLDARFAVAGIVGVAPIWRAAGSRQSRPLRRFAPGGQAVAVQASVPGLRRATAGRFVSPVLGSRGAPFLTRGIRFPNRV